MVREDSRRGNAPPARSAQEPSAEQPPKRGRGRPKENRGTVVITLRLPPDVVEAADEIVAASGHVYRDRSEFFRQTIARAVTKPTREELLARLTAAPLPEKVVREFEGQEIELAVVERGGSERVSSVPTQTKSTSNDGDRLGRRLKGVELPSARTMLVVDGVAYFAEPVPTKGKPVKRGFSIERRKR